MLVQTPNKARLDEDTRGVSVSFEFFPPHDDKMDAALWTAIRELEPLSPAFVSVTYGAGGSTRERTHATVERLLRETTLKPAAHLTCVAATRAEIDEVISGYKEIGVRHIVALRGDPPGGIGEAYTPFPGGYENAADLVGGIRRIGDFEVSVSAYPEKHPESPDIETDFDMLKAKIDAGATRAITQFFFDNRVYYDYVEAARKRGITIPIVPGILPVLNFKSASGFATKCGAGIPPALARAFEGLDNDAETRRLVAAAIMAEQVSDLHDHGVRDFHFYTMNRARFVYTICHLLGLRPGA
ncbi:MAG: methylenetetrahydrofolate reductase [NAD(P)H] [Hyphomicrobiales bacterium]|nr:MAG: methylenetetrahydrofolate reductase [NAD(P)H] [Hyphomicrobiales bacterium]